VGLIELVIILIVIGLLLYLVRRLPIDGDIKLVIEIIIIVVIIIVLLSVVFGHGHYFNIRV